MITHEDKDLVASNFEIKKNKTHTINSNKSSWKVGWFTGIPLKERPALPSTPLTPPFCCLYNVLPCFLLFLPSPLLDWLETPSPSCSISLPHFKAFSTCCVWSEQGRQQQRVCVRVCMRFCIWSQAVYKGGLVFITATGLWHLFPLQ